MVKPGSFGGSDYRFYDPDGDDGQSKLAHVAAMLDDVVYSAVFLGEIIPPKINLRQLPFATVLMDSWYATQKLMAQIDQLEKVYYCPLKANRRVDDSRGTQPTSVLRNWSRVPKSCSKASSSLFF